MEGLVARTIDNPEAMDPHPPMVVLATFLGPVAILLGTTGGIKT